MTKRIIPVLLILTLIPSCGEKLPPRVEVSTVSLNTLSLTLFEGESSLLTATVYPAEASDTTLIWTSSNTSIASVSEGQVTAVREGSAIITVSCGGKSATCSVTVNKTIPVTSVSLHFSSLTILKGYYLSLIATIEPDDATYKTVTWTSSNPSVAIVESWGVSCTLHMVDEGKAVITVSCGEAKATCDVTVCAGVTGDIEGTSDEQWN